MAHKKTLFEKVKLLSLIFITSFISEKIKNGASFSTILNEIRNSVGKEIKRKHLVTNKDLHNIVTTFKKLSKPNSGSSDVNESSSSSIHTVLNTEESIDNPNSGFNNDLDICADLWVETCQRMINQSGQPLHDLCSKEDLVMRNHSDSTKNSLEEGINSVQPDSVSNISDQYLRGNEFSTSSSSFSALTQSMPSDTNVWSKQPHYSYSGQDLCPHLDLPDASNLPHSVAEEVHRDLNVFCNIQMMDDVQMHKDIYSSGSSLTLNNSSGGISPQEVITSSVCSSSYYSVASTSDASSGIRCVQDVSSYRQSMNSSIPSPENVFDASCIIPDANNTNYDDLSSPEKPTHEINKKNPLDRAILNKKLKQTCSKAVREKDDVVSDLRDRVNSVTALFNIVESELDERKKNIIRNYVDNMFRVLQYRYNKCKTKKKQSVKHKKYQSAVQKRLNRRRGNQSNLQKHRKSNKPKVRPYNEQKHICQPSNLASSNFSAKISEPYQNGFSNAILTDIRSDINVLHWDRYESF